MKAVRIALLLTAFASAAAQAADDGLLVKLQLRENDREIAAAAAGGTRAARCAAAGRPHPHRARRQRERRHADLRFKLFANTGSGLERSWRRASSWRPGRPARWRGAAMDAASSCR